MFDDNTFTEKERNPDNKIQCWVFNIIWNIAPYLNFT